MPKKFTEPVATDKEIVFGMVERDGKVRGLHVDRRRRHELRKAIRENVEAGSALFSDELLSYQGLSDDHEHAVIDHAVEYAGNVHTNTMENFWSLLKRGLDGTTSASNPSICSDISTTSISLQRPQGNE